MIRIYLDWNVFSNLKNEEFDDFRHKLLSNKSKLLFPYSPAHFDDLMKSYSPENEMFKKDLKTLDDIAVKHLLRWEKERTNCLFCVPSQYFLDIKDNYNQPVEFDINNLFDQLDGFGTGKLGKTLKSLFENQVVPIDINDENKEVLNQMFPNLKPDSNMLDFFKDIGFFSENFIGSRPFYKEFRKTLNDKGLKVESNSGNWNENEVIENISAKLNSLGANLTFQEYVDTAFKYRKQPVTRFEFFKTAYLMLDMIGYKPDKLKKPTDTAKNIVLDSEHAFYGAHCDFFVAIDKNLRIKSKVLYSEFNIPTKVLSLEEFIESLEDLIHLLLKLQITLLKMHLSILTLIKLLKSMKNQKNAKLKL